MKADVFWKQVCDRNLPDFDAVERAILALPVPRRPFRGVRITAAAVALTVLAAGAAGLLGRGGPAAPAPQTPEPVLSAPVTEAEQEPAEPQEESPEEASEPQPEADVVVFNELEQDQVAAALDVGMAEFLQTHAQRWDLAQILDYWGFDPLPRDLPEGLDAAFDGESTWAYAAADGVVWDQFAFTWREYPGGDVYDPLERKLTVTVAGSEIFACGINFFEEEMETSTVSGVEMCLGRRDVGYGPWTDGPGGVKVPAGYYPQLEAQFVLRGLHFRVTAENLSEAEFVAVLKDMAE